MNLAEEIDSNIIFVLNIYLWLLLVTLICVSTLLSYKTIKHSTIYLNSHFEGCASMSKFATRFTFGLGHHFLRFFVVFK